MKESEKGDNLTLVCIHIPTYRERPFFMKLRDELNEMEESKKRDKLAIQRILNTVSYAHMYIHTYNTHMQYGFVCVRVRACVWVYIHTYIHTYTYVASLNTLCMRTYLLCLCIHTHIRIYILTYMHTFLSICVCVCKYIYIHTYTLHAYIHP